MTCEKCYYENICKFRAKFKDSINVERECFNFAKEGSVVEVVRCRDCIHSKRGFMCKEGEIFCKILCSYADDDDYCKNGERITDYEN